MKFGVGIIGATGFIGTPYRSEIRESPDEARIVALCARRRDRLEEAAAKDGAEVITSDWREVVEHPDVDLVLVLTPDALHFEPVMACAALKKHVFCEKPVGKNADQAYSIWKAYRTSGLGHFVPYWTRYVPAFERARQLVVEGKLGEIRNVVYRWHNPRPVSMPFTWRDDAELSAAGSLADIGSHAYDTLRFILGDEAKRVLAFTDVIMPAKPDLGTIDLAEALSWANQLEHENVERQRKATVPDYAQLVVQFSRGTVGCLVLSHASYLRKGFAPELELHGTKASLSVDRIRSELLFADSPEPAVPYETLTDPGFGNRFTRHVFPAIRQRAGGQHCTHAGLEDGWRVQVFTDASFASAQRGGWVDLSEFEKERN